MGVPYAMMMVTMTMFDVRALLGGPGRLINPNCSKNMHGLPGFFLVSLCFGDRQSFRQRDQPCTIAGFPATAARAARQRRQSSAFDLARDVIPHLATRLATWLP